MSYYRLAQEDALTAMNYKQGWATSGLWPVRMSKPLMNRLLLENSNKPEEQILVISGNCLVPDWNQNSLFVD